MKYALLLLLAAARLPGKDSCLECHSQMAGDLQAPAAAFRSSVHLQHGFTCAACHGGDPNSDDPEAAMSKAHGFVGVPPRTAVPKLCARCHSDPNFMRKYNPSERVDQDAEYETSVHGQRLAKGDVRVAVCIDCHGVHDIRAARDALSPVYPLNLPKTCAQCHADAAHMAPYKIPTDQYANYLNSSLTSTPINLQMAQQVLRHIVHVQDRKITIDAIQKAVAERFQIKATQLKEKSNTQKVVRPRQVAMYLVKELTDASLPEIGRAFGGKHHTTVIHSIRKIEKERQANPELNRLIHSLMETLQ